MAISSTLQSPVPVPAPREPAVQPVKQVETPQPITQTASPSTKPVETPPASPTSRRTTLEQSTGEFILQVIDDHTGQKISQSPDEAILRIRAYARQLDTVKQPVPLTPKAPTKG
jgi:hypothetical protein